MRDLLLNAISCYIIVVTLDLVCVCTADSNVQHAMHRGFARWC